MTFEEAVKQLDELAKKYKGVREDYSGKLTERTWDFPSANWAHCWKFAQEAEALGFQMWAGANLSGLLWGTDKGYVINEPYTSCVDGKVLPGPFHGSCEKRK